MEINPDNYYRMPLIMGPQWEGKNPRLLYPQTEFVALQYLTDAESISAMLPNCYKVGKEPQVNVLFGYNNGLEFMAGGGYIIAAIQVSARFDGDKEHIEGDYILVMFENQAWPMICGREDLGIPKLFADISPIKVSPDGSLRCEASYWGHLLFSLELSPPKKQNRIVKLAANKILNSRPWLGYKYIPSLDGPPDADYPTISWNNTNVKELWFAKTGKVHFGNATSNEIGQLNILMDALKTLTVKQVKQALHFKGSAVLRYDLSRRLF
jgi:acetoacetate decarboxylase